MAYLLVGQDCLSKDVLLKKIRQEFLSKETEHFNLDILYAKELILKDLQERLFYLPVKSTKRVVVIKDAQNLKSEIKEFILKYVLKPHKQTILVLDIGQIAKADEFIKRLYKYAKVYRFKETKRLDTFTLSRWIALKRIDYSLQILNLLLKNGERPERILGGLRYVWEKERADSLEAKRKLKLLLDCDIDIKTGKLKAAFALERLVINLCGFGKSLH